MARYNYLRHFPSSFFLLIQVKFESFLHVMWKIHKGRINIHDKFESKFLKCFWAERKDRNWTLKRTLYARNFLFELLRLKRKTLF